MLLSLACHGAMFLLVPYLADLASSIDYQRSEWSAFHLEQMRLRVPEAIYYPPAGSPAKPAQARNVPVREARKKPAPGAAQQSPARADARIPPGMEIAPTPKWTAEAPVILQPDAQRSDLARLAKALPLLAFWARQGPDLPKPPRKQLVLPGRNEAPTPPPQMPAPPVIAIPNREAAFADLNIALPPGPASAKLSVPNSTTAPVRDSQADPRPGAANSIEGQAANVIALSANRARPDEIVTIPRSLQNTPPPGAGPGTQTPSQSTSPPSGGAEPAQGQEARAASRLSAAAADKLAATGGRGVAGGSRGADAASALKPAVNVPPAASQAVTRIDHPANGNFDVVIMQSARDDLPDVKSLLAGSPVFTVYLQVGDRREWLLEFCMPPGERSHNNPYEVYVDDAGPLSPPYPVSTVIPNNIIGQRRSKAITLHGFLTVAGRFRNLDGRDAGNQVVRDIAALLDQWQFRPASRNKTPTEVEIVLVVPAVSE